MTQPVLLMQYLRCLRAEHSHPSTDHELLQRFMIHHDESAFAALVQRHGPLVLGLCRSILRHHHDAEDIFQAVFLVLARKAGSIRKGESVGSWLYAVASRLAHKARRRAGKRRMCEQQAATSCEQTPMDEVTWGELRDILHAEVSRLPEKYRAAVVLCYWQGRTHEQAGQQLGCARATIKDRLEKARELLRKRLARRGLALSGAWFAAALSEGTTAAVPADLMQTTVRGAMLFSMGQLPARIGSSSAAAYAQGFVKGMLRSKLRHALAWVLMLSVLGGGAGLAMLRESLMLQAPAEPPAPAVVKAEQKPVDRHGELRRLDCGDTSINALAFSPDSKLLAAAGGTFGRGNCLLLWDTATGRQRRSLAPKHTLHSVVFSPDGRTLAASGRRSILAGDSQEEREITLWEVATGRQRWTLKHDEGITELAFSPDGRLLAAACNKTYTYSHLRGDGCVDALEQGKPKQASARLWDVVAEKELALLEGHQGAIAALAFSPDGTQLSTGSNDTTVLLWDVSRFKPSRPAEVRLRTEQIESLWGDLAGADAVQAYRAIRALAAAPKSSVAFLQKHLRSIEPADAKQIARLLANLDSDEFTVRDKAMQQLENLGESAVPELRKSLAGKPSLEVKCRIEQLLEKQTGVEHIRMVRALETLERIGTPQARELCASLAKGVADAPLTREARAT